VESALTDGVISYFFRSSGFFVTESCAAHHVFVDPFRNALAIPTDTTFPSLAYRQFSMHLDRQLSSASLATRLEVDD